MDFGRIVGSGSRIESVVGDESTRRVPRLNDTNRTRPDSKRAVLHPQTGFTSVTCGQPHFLLAPGVSHPIFVFEDTSIYRIPGTTMK